MVVDGKMDILPAAASGTILALSGDAMV